MCCKNSSGIYQRYKILIYLYFALLSDYRCHFFIKTVLNPMPSGHTKPLTKWLLCHHSDLYCAESDKQRYTACKEARGNVSTITTSGIFSSLSPTHTQSPLNRNAAQCLKGKVKQSSRWCGGQWQSSHSPSEKVSPRFSLSPSRPPVPPYHWSDSL